MNKIVLVSLILLFLFSFTSAFILSFDNGKELEVNGEIVYYREFGENNDWKVIKYFDGQNKTILIEPVGAGRISVN